MWKSLQQNCIRLFVCLFVSIFFSSFLDNNINNMYVILLQYNINVMVMLWVKLYAEVKRRIKACQTVVKYG